MNKPDQRFDPNFRKAHSFHDLTVNESDGDEPNIEINEKSPFPKNAYPTELSRITELSSARSQYQSPVRGYSNMREKDVSFENPPPRPNWNEIQKDRTYEKNDRYNTMNLSDRERSMRFSPGCFSIKQLWASIH